MQFISHFSLAPYILDYSIVRGLVTPTTLGGQCKLWPLLCNFLQPCYVISRRLKYLPQGIVFRHPPTKCISRSLVLD
jgi:hypothetical protein